MAPGLDCRPRRALLVRPSDRRRDLLPPLRVANQLIRPRASPAEGEVHADRAGRPLRDGRIHPHWDGGRARVPDERLGPNWRAPPGTEYGAEDAVREIRRGYEGEIRGLTGPAEALLEPG